MTIDETIYTLGLVVYELTARGCRITIQAIDAPLVRLTASPRTAYGRRRRRLRIGRSFTAALSIPGDRRATLDVAGDAQAIASHARAWVTRKDAL